MTLKKKSKAVILFAAAIITGTLAINSCVHAPYVLPDNLRNGDPTICFENDVLPIFQSNCAKSGCHDQHGAGGYKLDSYKDIMKKGIVAGNIDASTIWQSIYINTGDNFMPRGAARLTDGQLDVIKRWISTGAIDSGACSNSTCDTTTFTYSGVIAPMMQQYCTGCHNSTRASGGSLMDYTSVSTAAVSGRLIGDISHLAGYNAMPQGGAQLQDCQITQVKKWVAAGAPNN